MKINVIKVSEHRIEETIVTLEAENDDDQDDDSSANTSEAGEETENADKSK